MAVTDCSVYFLVDPDKYRRCKRAEAALERATAQGGGNPWGQEALQLVEQFLDNIGLLADSQLPPDHQANPRELLNIVNQLRDQGSLALALDTSELLNSWLLDTSSPEAETVFCENLNIQARILNGLGQQQQAIQMLNIANFVSHRLALSGGG